MGTDKAFLRINGNTLIKNMVMLLQAFCNDIIISANNPEPYISLGIQTIPDEKPGLGPVGGIITCLKHSNNDKNLVIAVDMPYINASFLRFLLSNASKADLVIPINRKGQHEPLCAVYSRSLIMPLEKMIALADFKLQNLPDLCDTYRLFIPDNEDTFPHNLFHNLNSPADLDILSE